MPLTSIDEPAEVDAFGVRFTMEERGRRVRCHVFRSAIHDLEDYPAGSADEQLARFKANRGVFERQASRLYDAGHQTPWIESIRGEG
jgi:hypothetical protein